METPPMHTFPPLSLSLFDIYKHTHTHIHADMQMLRTKMESWKARSASRSKANALCKKHPKHRQSPGVCSICLNEKLSQLSNSDTSSSSSRAARSRSSSSSSLSTYVSSSNASSSCSSPVADHRRRRLDARNSVVRVFNKSRSMALVSNKIGIVKGGFWSKLLPTKNRGLMHSRTTRERVVEALH